MRKVIISMEAGHCAEMHLAPYVQRVRKCAPFYFPYS